MSTSITLSFEASEDADQPERRLCVQAQTNGRRRFDAAVDRRIPSEPAVFVARKELERSVWHDQLDLPAGISHESVKRAFRPTTSMRSADRYASARRRDERRHPNRDQIGHHEQDRSVALARDADARRMVTIVRRLEVVELRARTPAADVCVRPTLQ